MHSRQGALSARAGVTVTEGWPAGIDPGQSAKSFGYFRDVDVFVCPVNFTAAFPHDPRPFGKRTVTTADGERPHADQAFWIAHASLAGLPAVAAPVGRPPPPGWPPATPPTGWTSSMRPARPLPAAGGAATA
jgi:hypothetical protein